MSSQPHRAQETTWAGLARRRQRAGPGADLCSQTCPTWKKQSPAPPSAVGTAQPSLGSLHMVRSWVLTGCAWCPVPWEPCGWDSCQAGHTPSTRRGSAALTQLTEPALEPRPAVTAVGLGIPGAGAAVPAGVRGAVLPLTCNTHTALRTQGCRTARPTPQQPPGMGQLWGMPCPLFSLQQGSKDSQLLPRALPACRLLVCFPQTYSCSSPRSAAVPDCPGWTPPRSPASLEPLGLGNERVKCHCQWGPDPKAALRMGSTLPTASGG